MCRALDGPGWRWQLAQHLARAGAADARADAWVLKARDHLRHGAAGTAAAETDARPWPDVAAAVALSLDAAASGPLMVLTLGGCPPEQVAARAGLDAGVLEAWERLFFDVRWAAGATDWILARVIGPEQRGGDDRLAAMLKFAHAGGPVAAEAVLDAEARLKVGQGASLFDKLIRLHLMCDQAMQLPLGTDRAKLFFLRRHAEILRCEQSLGRERERLQQRCREALLAQRRAEARLELEAARQRERADALARRRAERGRRALARQAREHERQGQALTLLAARDERRRRGEEYAALSPLSSLSWG